MAVVKMSDRFQIVSVLLVGVLTLCGVVGADDRSTDLDRPVPRSAPGSDAGAADVSPAQPAELEGVENPAEDSPLPTREQVGKNTGKAVKPKVSARLRLEYEFRKLGDYEDNDFRGRFYGSGRDLLDGRLDLYVSGRLYSDLDSKQSVSLADDPFRSLDDSDGVTEDRLLQAYADIHARDRRISLRGGRQYLEMADYIQIDGGLLRINDKGRLGGGFYLGQPVSYYTSVSGDHAAGVLLSGRPWIGNRSRLTVGEYHDESTNGDDRHYFLDIRQQFSDTSRVRGQLSLLNDEYRYARLDWFAFTPDGERDFSAGGSYWGSFDAETRVYSPLYNTLGEMDPYARLYARLTQQLVPGWVVSPGVSVRLADAGENAYNNRDYENVDVTLIYSPDRSFSASLALQYWAIEEGNSFLGISGDVRYRYKRLWEVSAGSSFAEYTYDTYSDITYSVNGGQTVFAENGTIIEQSPFVRTYYIRGKWKVARNLVLRAQCDVEDDDMVDDLAYRARGSVEVRY